MRSNPVREKLIEGTTVYGIMATEFLTPGFSQIAANAGAEFIIFDMEHGGIGIDVLKAQVAYARGLDITIFVRVPGLAYHLIAPVLDAGVMGIMVPMLETREQAEKLVEYCRYRPLGKRGVGFGVGHDDYKGGDIIDGMSRENDRTLVIGLIETATGISNVDSILSVPGIDVGWLGHYDLTDSMGITGQFTHPDFHSAVEKLLTAGLKHGKACGFMATSVVMAREWRAKGFRCLSYGNDTIVFHQALSGALQSLRSDPVEAQ